MSLNDSLDYHHQHIDIEEYARCPVDVERILHEPDEIPAFVVQSSEKVVYTRTESVGEERGDEIRIEKRHQIFRTQEVVEQIVDKSCDSESCGRKNYIEDLSFFFCSYDHYDKCENKEQDQIGSHESHKNRKNYPLIRHLLQP